MWEGVSLLLPESGLFLSDSALSLHAPNKDSQYRHRRYLEGIFMPSPGLSSLPWQPEERTHFNNKGKLLSWGLQGIIGLVPAWFYQHHTCV